MKQWRVILSGYNTPFRNMAIDEALIRSFRDGACLPTLRLYGWEPRGVSLGYAQDATHVVKTTPRITVVRRLTGGEAIVHQDDISYSIVCAQHDLDLPRGVMELIRADSKRCSIPGSLRAYYERLPCPVAGVAGDAR